MPKSLLPQGSAACVARRFRPLLWFERAMKFAKCYAYTKLYTYGEHPSSHSSSKMLWRRNPRCGTLRGHRLSCEHPSTTLGCIMMNPQSGGAFFFCCGGGGTWDVNRAAKCVYSKFRFNIVEREAHGCKRRGSAACVAKRFRLSSQFAKDERQTKTSIEMLMYHYGEHPSASASKIPLFRVGFSIAGEEGFMP